MKLTKRRILIGLGILILALISFFLYKNARLGKAEGGTPRYKEFAVKRGTFQIGVSASGVVRPIDRVEIKSKASGRIEELPVDEGDYVEKGTLIARLDQTDVQAELEQAKADLEIAKAELKQAQNTFHRQDQLFQKGLISDEERDQAVLLMAQARGRIVRAQTSLAQADVRFSETVVCAPISGVILQKYVEEGQIISSGISNVSGGTPIVDIADMRSVYIEAGVDEIDVGKVLAGQHAVVTVEAYPQTRFSGDIIRIKPEAKIEQNVTLFDVVIEVDNAEGKLKSGMNATVEITITNEENVLLAPTMALKIPPERGAKQNIRQALLKQGNEFVPRRVEIGLSDSKQTVIIGGLAEGDTLGVPMFSRLKAENERLEQRIKSSRGFGSSSSK